MSTDRTISAEEEQELTELEYIQTIAVGMVDRPANAVRFLVLKSQDKAQARAARLPRVKYTRRSEVKKQAEFEPKDTMSREELRDLRDKRSQEFGIEVLEGDKSALTFPSGYPTDLKLYGDPVNLAYPVDTAARARAARVYFKTNALSTYKEVASRRVIHNRIVEAELGFGIEPDYDPEDELDKLLSAELRDKLTEKSEEKKQMNPTEMIDELLATMTVGEPISEEMISALTKIKEALAEGEEAPAQGEPESMSADDPAALAEKAGEVEETAKMASARDLARQMLWQAMEAVDAGAVDSDEDKATTAQLLSILRDKISAAMGGGAAPEGETEPVESSDEVKTEKAGRKISGARVAVLRQTRDHLAKTSEMLDALINEADPPVADPGEKSEETPAQKSVETDQESEVLKAHQEEISVLKKEISELKQRAAPSVLAPTDGGSYQKQDKKKRLAPMTDVNANRQ